MPITHSLISDLLFQPASQLQLLLAEPVPKSFLETLVQRTQKFAVVNLLLRPELLSSMQKDPFIGPFLREMAQEGIRIKKSMANFEGVHLIVDQKQYYSARSASYPFEMQSVTRDFFAQNVFPEIDLHFSDLAQWIIAPTLPKPQISVKPSKVIQGESLVLHWEAKEWDQLLTVDGQPHPPQGQLVIRPNKTGAVVCCFSKGNIHHYELLKYEVLDGLEVQLGLRIKNTLTKQWTELQAVDPNEPFYAVHRGQEVELHWSVNEADEVHIEPLGLSGLRGSHRFKVTEKMEWSVFARLSKQVKRKKMYVLPYPVELVDTSRSFSTERVFRDLKNRFGHTFSLPGFSRAGNLDALRVQLEAKRQHLLDRWKKMPKLSALRRAELRKEVLDEYQSTERLHD